MLGKQPGIGHRYIMVDQFGYRPSDPKVAVIADPRTGYNAHDTFTPAKIYEVHDAHSRATVFSGPLVAYREGHVDEASGDAGYWFDFSRLRQPGSYYLYDPVNKVRSHVFEIATDVYSGVLQAALRMFFYNRAGADKRPPYADPRWSDTRAYVGPGQDGEARAVDRKDDPSTERDLRGGWFDAGDTNKYVNNAGVAVHQLLAAYRERPEVWSDSLDIPESGNGLPDIIDEIKWEIDWLERMQEPEGGVLIKVGNISWDKVSPPGNDRQQRFYAPACSSSTITAAGIFAHAAKVFSRFAALEAQAERLRERAERAWRWYHAQPKRDDCDTREVKAGSADRSVKTQASEAVVAAIYLFALTSDPDFRQYVYKNQRLLRPYRSIGWTRYAAHQGEALLYFTTLPGVSQKFRKQILASKRRDATAERSRVVYAAGLTTGLYRAHMPKQAYHWGSNRVVTNQALSNVDMVTFGLAGSHSPLYRARALGMLHYLHGVNPQGMVYVSNMSDYGAEVSAAEIFHQWFFAGTPWHSTLTSDFGPAPGYLVGGPNQRYSGPLSPPKGQPSQKSYLDHLSDNWREKIWEVTEPSITYQGAYVKLLSKFVPAIDAPKQ